MVFTSILHVSWLLDRVSEPCFSIGYPKDPLETPQESICMPKSTQKTSLGVVVWLLELIVFLRQNHCLELFSFSKNTIFLNSDFLVGKRLF